MTGDIAVDTSALMAVLLGETGSDRIAARLEEAPRLVVSAATLAEALIVADSRGIGFEMRELVQGLGVDILPLTARGAALAAAAYSSYGRGNHPAGLNLGDCFSYAAATEAGIPLLYTGQDFSRTDLPSAL